MFHSKENLKGSVWPLSLSLTTNPTYFASYLFFSAGGCCDLKSGDLLPGLLCFRSMKSEIEYQKQPDPSFPYYVACSIVLFIVLAGIQLILIPR